MCKQTKADPGGGDDDDNEKDKAQSPSLSFSPNTTSSTTKEPTRPPNAFENASFLSKLLFIWPYTLLKTGLERPLQAGDLPSITNRDGSTVCRDGLLKLWNKEKEQYGTSSNNNNTNNNNSNSNKKATRPRLERAIFVDFYKELWYIQPLVFAAMSARVIQAVALGNLVESLESSGGNNGHGYIWASVLVICGIVFLMEHHHVFLYAWHKGARLRIASVAAIYDKAFRLSAHQENSSGKILNLASNDVERYQWASLFTHYIFWGPVQALAILVLGVIELGLAFFIGFVLLLVVVVPLQLYLANRFAHYRSKVAAITDQRVSLVSQAVYGARVMKMNGWEWQFLDRIQAIRKREVAQIQKANSLKAWNEALFFSTNVVVSVVIFLTYIGLGGTLTPRSLFIVFNLVNILQVEMTKHVSIAVMGASECYVSIQRIQAFLEYPELPRRSATKSKTLEGDTVLSLRNVTSYWNEVVHSKDSSHHLDGKKHNGTTTGAAAADDDDGE